jgi:ATP-binding cassette subfamily E protein 1
MKVCPPNQGGSLCIEIEDHSFAKIAENLCIGCGSCVRRCPFGAITIVKIPTNLEKDVSYRFGENLFKLHRLPIPRPGEVLGLVASNGLGKSTALKILAGEVIPNFGRSKQPGIAEVVAHFRGSELQAYFTKLYQDELDVSIKKQYVDELPKEFPGLVKDYLTNSEWAETFSLSHLMERPVPLLSGGEVQRFALAMTCSKKSERGIVYLFDEPSSFLDVKQRINAGKAIRSLANHQNYIFCVEHDLSLCDYLSDSISVFYGVPGAYGVVTTPFSTKEGINIFLDGFIRTENLRFRDDPLTFKVIEIAEDFEKAKNEYPAFSKVLETPESSSKFTLEVEAGSFNEGEINVIIGENGLGKSSFLEAILESFKDRMVVSYKPQKITPKSDCTVRELFHTKIPTSFTDAFFQNEVVKPLKIDRLLDQNLKTLSGGELQRVATILALGKQAQIYLIDEVSAYLDADQRIIVGKVIKRWIIQKRAYCFVIEHDLLLASYLSDKVIVFEGEPGVHGKVKAPMSLVQGMNLFLKSLDVTFRRDPGNFRPRINKLNSQKDQEQKINGTYFT